MNSDRLERGGNAGRFSSHDGLNKELRVPYTPFNIIVPTILPYTKKQKKRRKKKKDLSAFTSRISLELSATG